MDILQYLIYFKLKIVILHLKLKINHQLLNFKESFYYLTCSLIAIDYYIFFQFIMN